MCRACCLVFLSSLCALSACSSAPTQIVVRIDTDFAVPDELTSVRLVRGHPNGQNTTRTLRLVGASGATRPGETRVPFSFTLVPSSEGAAEAVTISVVGLGPAAEPVVEQHVVTAFRPHQTLLLPIFLGRACAGAVCERDTDTCLDGACASATVLPSRLRVIAPGQELPYDAGPSGFDAGDLDAGDLDAGDLDAGLDAGGDMDAGECATFVECDDDDPCTTDDCVDQVCTHDAVLCADHQACVAGVCTCDDGFTDCDLVARTGCEAELAIDTRNCGTCGLRCPSSAGVCEGGECRACRFDGDCLDDGLACTASPRCVAGGCVQTLMTGACLIDGACHLNHARNPANQCEECRPATPADAIVWTTRTDEACDDGTFCTLGETCTTGGRCTNGSPISCDDGIECTTDSCNEAMNRCEHPVQPGHCLIGSACVATGERDPTMTCQECNPSVSETTWTRSSMGAMCASAPCLGGACTAAGTCQGFMTPRPLPDGTMCMTEAGLPGMCTAGTCLPL